MVAGICLQQRKINPRPPIGAVAKAHQYTSLLPLALFFLAAEPGRRHMLFQLRRTGSPCRLHDLGAFVGVPRGHGGLPSLADAHTTPKIGRPSCSAPH